MDNKLTNDVVDDGPTYERDTNDIGIVTPVDVTPKPTRTRTRTNKPAVAVKLPPMPRTLRTIDDVITVARHVTPATFDTIVTRFTANHGVTLAQRNVGRYTGARVMDFQNVFMADNHGLNDCQILAAFRIEHPASVGRIIVTDAATGVSIVRGVRAEYNRNGHGSKSDAWKTVKSEPFGPTRFDFPKPAVVKSA